METEFVAHIMVHGTPIAQGSMSAFTRGKRVIITDQKSKRLKPWRNAIYQQARKQIKEPLGGPIVVTLTFYLLRPKNQMTAKGKATRYFKPYPTAKPDLDKLTRAVLDGLTGAAFHDDSQVVELDVMKLYGTREGVKIRIERLCDE